MADLGYPGLSAIHALPLGTSTPCTGALPGVMPGAITQLRVWNSGVLIADGTLVAQGASGGGRIGAGKLFWSPPSRADPQATPVTMLDYTDLSTAANTTQNCTLSNRGVVLGDTYVDACFCVGGGGGSVQIGLGPGGKTVVSPLVNGFLMNTLAVDRVSGELLTDQSTPDGTGSLSINIVALKLHDLGSKSATPRMVISGLNQVCGTTGLPGRGVRNACLACKFPAMCELRVLSGRVACSRSLEGCWKPSSWTTLHGCSTRVSALRCKANRSIACTGSMLCPFRQESKHRLGTVCC